MGSTFVKLPKANSGGQVAVQFQDEGSNLGSSGTVTTVNFQGAGVTASRTGNVVTANITAGGTPSGPAGGDLSGTYPNPTVDKVAVGINNVDNTSDLNKPISTATQIALDVKASIDASIAYALIFG